MSQTRIRIPGDTPEGRLRAVARLRSHDGTAPDERRHPPRPPSPEPGTAIERDRRDTLRRLTETDTDA
ncbi:hypothetical protein [Nocardia sp. XZ_19_231]|uniref:hypothetical protein n=1 Tax=Nocardia sp. XZ_19_231 TaxID=2769252 RepID=UPI0018905DB5|nr:hypothetical protein [Nocardia sp. XZ_19_231]